jgi:hypothetical protein
MTGNGYQEISRAMELGKAFRMSSIAANGTQTSQMGLESMCGEMEIFMKVNGKHA